MENKIHQILKKLIVKTGIGEIEEGYADDLNFNIGEYTIYSCGYYQQLMVNDEEGNDHELDKDFGAVKMLCNEIEKREKEFDGLIVENGLNKVNKIFEKPFEINFEN